MCQLRVSRGPHDIFLRLSLVKLVQRTFVSVFLTKKCLLKSVLKKYFIPFTGNIKNIPSVHRSSILYLRLRLMHYAKKK